MLSSVKDESKSSHQKEDITSSFRHCFLSYATEWWRRLVVMFFSLSRAGIQRLNIYCKAMKDFIAYRHRDKNNYFADMRGGCDWQQ